MIDVRIRRADLPDQNSQAVYQRMQTERQREAAEFRAQGSQKSQEIRSKADRDVTVLVAEATSKSEQTRGEGDGERNRIFAEAFGQDPDFFSFYRSMQAYEAGMAPQRYPHGAQSRFRVLPLFRRSERQAARGRGASGQPAAAGASHHRLAAALRTTLAFGFAGTARGRVGCFDVRLSGRDRPGFRHRRDSVRSFPAMVKRAIAHVLETPDTTLRLIGIVSAVVGVVVVWLVRG